MKRNITSLAAYLVVVAALLGLIFIGHLFATHPILFAVQVGALALMIWARVILGRRSFHVGAEATRGGLVIHGPYRFWRHPIYASIIYFVWAGQLEDPNMLAIVLSVIVTVGLVVRMLLEEKHIVSVYPEYIEYAEHTRRIIPYVL